VLPNQKYSLTNLLILNHAVKIQSFYDYVVLFMIILVHDWIPKILSSIIVGLSTHSYREQRISISWAWCYSHLCTSIMGPWCPRFKRLLSASRVAPTDIALSWLLLRPSISMRLLHVTNHPVRDGLVIISLYLEQNITYESMSYLKKKIHYWTWNVDKNV
jgi:hypothetical protein